MKRKGCSEELLKAALSALASEGAPDTPAAVEQRVLAAFDARGPLRFGWWTPIAAAVAAAVLVAVIVHRPASPPGTAEAPFVEIPYVAPLAPYERISVKRMDVPVAALIAAGFDIEAPDTGTSLRADVLFGQDGRAHAIRLIQTTKDN